MNRMRYAVIALCLLFLVAGCRAHTANFSLMPPNMKQPISSPATFLSLYGQWTENLAGLVGEINASYSNWNNNQISQRKFMD